MTNEECAGILQEFADARKRYVRGKEVDGGRFERFSAAIDRAIGSLKAQGIQGTCRGKKKDDPEKAWYIGEVISNGERAFMLWKEDIRMESGTIGGWIELDPDTVQRFTGKQDSEGLMLFEGDVIGTEASRFVNMEICYGRYGAFCPNDQQFMENIGFFVVSNTTDDAMPLGPTEDYAHLIGNIVDNPELAVV